jgi:diguanylate cyclase (GGDEF)-like protein
MHRAGFHFEYPDRRKSEQKRRLAKQEIAMRVAAMLKFSELVGSDITSETQAEETLRELFSKRPHIVAALGIALVALDALWNGSIWSSAVALLISVLCLIYRVIIEQRFLSRPAGPIETKWVHLFVSGATISGISWGLALSLLIYDQSASTQIIAFAVACAIVQGAAGRAYMMPGTAFINIGCVLGAISIAGIANGSYLFALGAALYFAFLASFILQMVRNRLAQLQAEHRTEQLIQEITEKNELLRFANEKLAATAFEDPLTGLANRRKFDRTLTEALAMSQQEQSFISVLMIDVDNFKSFNDTYGHQAGDHCLKVLSKAISTAIPDKDCLLARYGGEEFVVLLPGYDPESSLLIAERARAAVELSALSAMAGSPRSQTISIGLVTSLGGPMLTRETLLSASDAALYEAKRQGRNRVCVYSDLAQSAPQPEPTL